MKLSKGDKEIVIPGWALLLGVIVLDNVVANICKAVTWHKTLKEVTK